MKHAITVLSSVAAAAPDAKGRHGRGRGARDRTRRRLGAGRGIVAGSATGPGPRTASRRVAAGASRGASAGQAGRVVGDTARLLDRRIHHPPRPRGAAWTAAIGLAHLRTGPWVRAVTADAAVTGIR